jgi:hypothetical protein
MPRVREIEAELVHADDVTGTVVIDGEAIETTPEHPFFSLERGFVPAAELRPGELVATASGEPGVVNSVAWTGGPAVMWNLTVGIDHTFFVGAGGWWVHNACKDAIRNDHLAGTTHPETGVPFDEGGFADFSTYRHPDVPDVKIVPGKTRGPTSRPLTRLLGSHLRQRTTPGTTTKTMA